MDDSGEVMIFRFLCEAQMECIPGPVVRRVVALSARDRERAQARLIGMGYEPIRELDDRELVAAQRAAVA
jgi:hypothetical protein